MQNTRHADECAKNPELETDPTYPKFVIVVTQFEAKLNSTKILSAMKNY